VEGDQLDAVLTAFNTGRYRACVEPLETLYFPTRLPAYKGLIQVTVALLQLDLGLVSGPRYLLGSARRLLSEAGSEFAGIDVTGLVEQVEGVERWLASGREKPRPPVVVRRTPTLS
jgi:hypothetical protein